MKVFFNDGKTAKILAASYLYFKIGRVYRDVRRKVAEHLKIFEMSVSSHDWIF